MDLTEKIKPYDQYDNNFINTLLGEMKNKFNTEELQISQEDVEVDKIKEDTENEDLEKFSSDCTRKGSKDSSPNKGSFRQKNVLPEEKPIKRSSRTRNKDSVLQNAIARKEKSYNETSKPQRLSRQLRPTIKVLENIAQAKKVKKVKLKIRDNSSDSDRQNNTETSEKSPASKFKLKKHGKSYKRRNDSEISGSDNFNSDEECEVGRRTFRKSHKLASSQLASIPNQLSGETEDIPDSSESCIAVNAQFEARICLCTLNTNFYPINTSKDVVCCSAIDSIDERLVGCTREVNVQLTPLLRPSRRIPYMSLCELHKNRLIRHNCCPTCGIFCTQGKFLQCEEKHQYHPTCGLSLDNRECCPHCGLSTPSRDILLKFQSSKTPVFFPVQKSERPHAKITFPKACDQIRCITPFLIPFDSLQTFNNALTNGTDVDYSENDILDAIRDEDAEKLASIIISNSMDLHFKLSDFNEGTLLHYAALKGMLRICHLLISLGFQINEMDKEQNTPLMLAITGHKIDVVQYLVKAGSNIILKGTDGMTALHVSSKCGNLEACKILLQAGAVLKNYINCQDDGGWTPLVWACENGFAEIVDFFIAKGADLKLRDVEYNEALHWAAFSGCSHILELLLNGNGDVNTVNAHGETPLHIAAREDRYNCVIVLIARGADVFLMNKNSETPLDCVPEDGLSSNPIILNMKLQSLVDKESRIRENVLLEDVSKGRELNPIQCLNSVDEDLEPKDYTYITKSFLVSDGISIKKNVSSLQICKCEERCTGSDCLCGKLSVKCWYDEDGKLTVDFNYSDTPIIFECSDTCACNAITCRNRVVQKGSLQRFQVFKTEKKGWSVRTLKFISKGCFVCEYVGEILTDAEADRREDDSFLFDLGTKDTESFCVDARYYGNMTRFINHSCSPNLHPIKVFVDHQDIRFPRIAFFALRDIPVGNELSFDYGPKFWIAKYKSFTCSCESVECRYSEEYIEHALANVAEENLDEDSSSS